MKIIVADDNSDSRQLIVDIVESIGINVVQAQDGFEALELVMLHHPDLVILDVNMPGKTGFEVCAAIKGEESTSQIPVLMLTALSEVENRVEGLDAGADDYLTKPFNPRELVARIQTRLRAKEHTDSLRASGEQLRRMFERYVSPHVVQQLMQDPSQVMLGGKLQDVTVMFTDLENFTGTSEQTQPEKLLSVLNSYHALVVKIIQDHGGTVDKFIGDGVMALYNTPVLQNDHSLRAVKTALDIQSALPQFHQQQDSEFRMGINIGINSGRAVVGNVGAPEIMDFTAIGDAVNLAARLQSLCKNSQILVSETTYLQVQDEVNAELIGAKNVKGRQVSVQVYELHGLR